MSMLTTNLHTQRYKHKVCGVRIFFRLGDLGHTIIGVDIGKEAFEKFFKKHNIEYTIEPVASCNGTLYKVTSIYLYNF